MKYLTEKESMIMEYVWEKNGNDVSLKELISCVENSDGYYFGSNRNTIAYMIKKLVEKGYVSTYHNNRELFVHPEISLEKFLLLQLKYTAERYYNGNIEPVKSILEQL